jgi:hypothetical protein
MVTIKPPTRDSIEPIADCNDLIDGIPGLDDHSIANRNVGLANGLQPIDLTDQDREIVAHTRLGLGTPPHL